MDMTDPELEILAKHLGHDVKTHKENYRLSHSTRELTVVSTIFMPPFEEGRAYCFAAVCQSVGPSAVSVNYLRTGCTY